MVLAPQRNAISDMCRVTVRVMYSLMNGANNEIKLSIHNC